MNTPPDLSLGEFRTLVGKAFRGAGYSWGLTEDASFSAKRLAESGLPAATIVADLLTTVDAHDLAAMLPADLDDRDRSVVCPIWVGACVADRGVDPGSPLSVAHVVAPQLIAPIAATRVSPDDDAAVVIEWPEGRCEANAHAIVLSGRSPERPCAVRIARSDIDVELVSRHDRVVLEHDVHAVLDGFAKRTYAPATEASRIAGAGPS